MLVIKQIFQHSSDASVHVSLLNMVIRTLAFWIGKFWKMLNQSTVMTSWVNWWKLFWQRLKTVTKSLNMPTACSKVVTACFNMVTIVCQMISVCEKEKRVILIWINNRSDYYMELGFSVFLHARVQKNGSFRESSQSCVLEIIEVNNSFTTRNYKLKVIYYLSPAC